MTRAEMLGAGFRRTSFIRTSGDNGEDCQRASQEKYPRSSHGQQTPHGRRLFRFRRSLVR
jgi:hypothetical protein